MNSASLIPLMILSILTVLYIIVLYRLRKGLGIHITLNEKTQPSVSVIVAARNEEANIVDCLEALAAQDYPVSLQEIIIVNDRSDDNTGKLIHSFCARFSHFRFINITKRHPKMAPKKWAIHSGIHRSSGEIILTTDADCTPPPGWIRHMAACFTDSVGFVSGFSPLSRVSRKTLFSRLVLLDGLALAGVACAGFAVDMPLTCTGRNLGYRRKAFDEAGGFTTIGAFVSGDDDLLMHQIRTRTGWQMVYATDASTHVPSSPAATFGAFIAQRTRHASKGRFYSPVLKGGLAGFYLMNLLLLAGPLLPGPFPGYLFLLGLKIGMEWLFLTRTAAVLQYEKALTVFPLAALLHIPYVVILGFWGQIGRFTRKGERYKTKHQAETD